MAASELFKQTTQSDLLALVVSLMVLDWKLAAACLDADM